MSTALFAGLMSQVYVPYPDSNIYLLECLILTAWLMSDAYQREVSPLVIFAWALPALVLAPLVVARWYAYRPLRPGESRKGGCDANYYLALSITTLLYTGTSAACNYLNFGDDLGFELIINCGFAVVGTALILSLAVRQDSICETGSPLTKVDRESQ